jgi:phytoene dehydrogenase-like protein
MKKNEFDVVVAGAGSNTLTAAAYLAKAGLKVVMLERNRWIGGGAVTRELTVPGFRHDPHSTSHIYISANPLIGNDELGLLSRFGLKYVYPEVAVVSVFDDHTVLVTYFDLDRTCESIARISQHDAEAYRKHVGRMQKLTPMFVSGLFSPPVPFGSFVALLDQSKEGRELIGIMNKSAYDVIDEMFESDKIKAHFLKFASESMTGPEEKGTGLIFFLLPAFVHSYPGGYPVGGSGGFSEALARCITHHGGQILTERSVSKVIVERGRAVGVRLEDGEEYRGKRAVIGAFHPHLLKKYISEIDADIAADASRVQPASFSAVLTNYALNAAPIYNDFDGNLSSMMVEFLPSKLETLRREFDELRYGRMPRASTLLCTENSRLDRTRVPEGKAELWLYHYAPFRPDGGAPERWDQEKERFADWMLGEYRRFTSNMGDENIIARHVESPLDHVRTSPSFQGGDIMGIGQYVYQFLGRRPTPELAQYAVPGIEGLYLSGPFMHPGGGVTGGGRATAIKIMSDLDIDFEKVVSRP